MQWKLMNRRPWPRHPPCRTRSLLSEKILGGVRSSPQCGGLRVSLARHCGTSRAKSHRHHRRDAARTRPLKHAQCFRDTVLGDIAPVSLRNSRSVAKHLDLLGNSRSWPTITRAIDGGRTSLLLQEKHIQAICLAKVLRALDTDPHLPLNRAVVARAASEWGRHVAIGG